MEKILKIGDIYLIPGSITFMEDSGIEGRPQTTIHFVNGQLRMVELSMSEVAGKINQFSK